MIEEIITLLRTNTNYKYYFNTTANVEDCIVYKYIDNSNDGIKRQSQLELRIIVKGIKESSLKTIETMSDTINGEILTIGDNELSNRILTVTQNGGGLLVENNTQTTQKIMFFDVKYKN